MDLQKHAWAVNAVAVLCLAASVYAAFVAKQRAEGRRQVDWCLRHARVMVVNRKEPGIDQAIALVSEADDPHLLRMLRSSRKEPKGPRGACDGTIMVKADAPTSASSRIPTGYVLNHLSYCSSTGEIGRYGRWYRVPEGFRAWVQKRYREAPPPIPPTIPHAGRG